MAKNAFTILEKREIPELHAVGIFAEHKKTGLQLFHLLNDDKENWFSFGFSTPLHNSTGVQHITEHTVLCGSKHYPLGDPFLTLSRQNLTTFLNAITFPDKTVYPASSIVESEYFTLMSVYADAVFFPTLAQLAFEQEGHRFEIDEDGHVSEQGVVFNEMLANYSDFMQVAYDNVVHQLFKGTVYEYDSGGNPSVIPDLTYEQFKAFHKKFYHPANCKLFLYGNIPTEKQMDFLDEKFLQYFDHSEAAEKIQPLAHFDKPKHIQATAPLNSTEDEKTSLVMALWSVGETQNIKDVYITQLIEQMLIGSDGSPLNKAILDAKLGEPFAYNGTITDYKNIVFSFGVSKVKKDNEAKVEELILDTINKIAQTQLDVDLVETALNKMEFEVKEIIRPDHNSPFALELMQKIYNTWIFGDSPFDGLNYIAVFEQLRDEIIADKNYLQREIQKKLADNKDLCIGTVVADKNFSADLQKAAQKKAKDFEATLHDSDKKALREKQDADEKAKLQTEDADIIPHCAPDNLPPIKEAPVKNIVAVAGIPAFTYPQNTNGITYINFALPFDTLNDDLYDYVNLYVSCLTEIGTKQLNWDESLAYQDKIFGSINVQFLFRNNGTPDFTELDNQALVCPKDIVGREWIVISAKMLDRFVDKGVEYLTNLFSSVTFEDTERLFDILKQLKTRFENVTPTDGSIFTQLKAISLLQKSVAKNERLAGLTQFELLKNAVKNAEADKSVLKSLGQKLQLIHQTVFENGMLLHITCEEKSMDAALASLTKNCAGFKPLQQKPLSSKTTASSPHDKTNTLLLFPAPIQVGFSTYAFDFLPYNSALYGKLAVFTSWLSSGPLWQHIRMVGGAYGVWATDWGMLPVLCFVTYRDPDAIRSVLQIKKILQDILAADISETEMEKLIVGAYGRCVVPKTPYGTSYADFLRLLSGKSYAARVAKIESLKKTTASDLKYFAQCLLEKDRHSVAAVIANKDTLADTAEAKKAFDAVITEKEI